MYNIIHNSNLIIQLIKTMGIKHLKSILSNKCKKVIGHFDKMTDFVRADRRRLFKKIISFKKINGPLEKMNISKNIDNIPYLLGIDAHLYITKYKRVFKKIECGFIKQITQLLSAGIIPVYVFDGYAPEQKKQTIKNRKNIKIKTRNRLIELLQNNSKILKHNFDSLDVDISNNQNFQDETCGEKYKENILKIMPDLSTTEMIEYIDTIFKDNSEINFNKTSNPVSVEHLLQNPNNTSIEYNKIMQLIKKSIHVENKDIEDLKKFLSFLKIPFIVANGEADDQMASLYNKNIIHACLSDDMDMLPKGCDNLIQISSDGICQYYLPEILTELNLSREQFVDLCILLGSDYNTSYIPMDANELFDTYVKCENPSIETFFRDYLDNNKSINVDQFKPIRKYFSFSNPDISDIMYFSLKKIYIDDILKYFQKIGILFNETCIKRFQSIFNKINNFIVSLPQNFFITH